MKTLIKTFKREDFEWSYFTSGGPGGQHQNKTATGVRCKHAPSGAVGEARDSRSREMNRRNAFVRMAKSKKFNDWVRQNFIEEENEFSIDVFPIEQLVRTWNYPKMRVTDHRTGNKQQFKNLEI